MKYPVIYEKSTNGWGAYIPDLPGCIALGFTLAETKRLIQESVQYISTQCGKTETQYPSPRML